MSDSVHLLCLAQKVSALSQDAYWTYAELVRDIERDFAGSNVMLVMDCCYAGSFEQVGYW